MITSSPSVLEISSMSLEQEPSISVVPKRLTRVFLNDLSLYHKDLDFIEQQIQERFDVQRYSEEVGLTTQRKDNNIKTSDKEIAGFLKIFGSHENGIFLDVEMDRIKHAHSGFIMSFSSSNIGKQIPFLDELAEYQALYHFVIVNSDPNSSSNVSFSRDPDIMKHHSFDEFGYLTVKYVCNKYHFLSERFKMYEAQIAPLKATSQTAIVALPREYFVPCHSTVSIPPTTSCDVPSPPFTIAD